MFFCVSFFTAQYVRQRDLVKSGWWLEIGMNKYLCLLGRGGGGIGKYLKFFSLLKNEGQQVTRKLKKNE